MDQRDPAKSILLRHNCIGLRDVRKSGVLTENVVRVAVFAVLAEWPMVCISESFGFGTYFTAV